MKSLTVSFITSRREPKFEWFADSLAKQIRPGDEIHLIAVDHFAADRWFPVPPVVEQTQKFKHVLPKPNIWNGPSRLPKDEWWAKSSALNSSIALCETEWWSWVDDRSVLMPGWLDRIKDAMDGEYAVCGSYEKHINMKVEDGVIVDPGEVIGVDDRPAQWQGQTPFRVKDWYGANGALPLEWCLAVNGFSEDICDSLGLEDCMFGHTLHNAGFPMFYDSRMKIIEDRTQGEIDGALKRTDKGIAPNDKSNTIVARFQGRTDSGNSYSLRDLRNRVLTGEPFGPPTASHFDWYDGQPISEM